MLDHLPHLFTPGMPENIALMSFLASIPIIGPWLKAKFQSKKKRKGD